MRSKSFSSSLRTLPLFLTVLAAVFYLCSSSASAQTFYGTVVGTATDTTGAVVPGAAVTITNNGTNEKRRETTNATGEYRFVNLVPGVYTVAVEIAGFKRFVRNPAEVQIDTATRVDAVMQLGAITETVEVSTAPPLLQTESGSLGSEIEGKTIEETPLNGRNTLNLMELVPGVVPQGNTGGAAASNSANGTSSAAFGNYQIGGGLPLQSAMLVDGAPINIMNKNFTALVPVQDVIQEFRVETNAASPEFGRYGGGVVNMTTKSGTNAFHGSIYEYLRNKDVNANSFFTKRQGFARPEFTQNQFGGTVGGPILKDKLFFFYGWEGIHIRIGVPTSTNVPTAAMRAGVFTAKITDPQGICNIQPYTGQTVNGQTFASGGYYISNMYQAGLKPGTTCGDPTGKILASFYPLPNSTNPTSNYFTVVSNGTDGHQQTGRIDYQLSPKQRVFGRYTLWNLIDKAPTVLPIVSQYNTAGSQNHNHTNQLAVGDTISLTPTLLLDVRADYLRQYGDALPPVLQGAPVNESQFGAAYGALAPFETYNDLPYATFNTGTQLHNFYTFTYNNLTRTYYNNYHLSGGLTKSLGKHTIKVGAEARLIQKEDIGSDQNPSGTFAFSSDLAGDEFANLLEGSPDSTAITTVKAVTSFNYYKAFYIGDTWQAAPRLTLNLGVRWELPGGIGENNNNDTVLLPYTVDPYTGVYGTAALVASSLYKPRTTLVPHNDLFGPRLGFAYRINDKTVLRGGYSLSYLPPDLQIGAYANAALTTTATTTNKNSATAVTYTLANPFPATAQYVNGFQPAPGRSNPAFIANYIGQSVSAPYPYSGYPASQELNFSVGREIRGNMLLDIGYAHTLGTHLPNITAGLDQLPDSYDSMGQALSAAPATPVVYNGTKLAAAYQTVGQTLRPYPAYTNYLNSAAFHGTTVYDALQMKFQKRFGSAGQIGAAYTWMKLLGDTDTEATSQELKSSPVAGAGEGLPQDYTNPRADRSIYSYDVPNRLVISYILNLPFGRGQRFAAGVHGIAGAAISGWSFSGITTLQSGYPVYLYTGGNFLSKYFGAGTIRPNYAAGCQRTINDSGFNRTLPGHTWFNTGCFSVPTSTSLTGTTLTGANAYAFGNESRTDEAIKSGGVDNWDFSLVKSTPIHDTVALQFRAEFFNVFNRVQFGPPVTAADNAAFGTVGNQNNQPRLIQGALRLNF